MPMLSSTWLSWYSRYSHVETPSFIDILKRDIKKSSIWLIPRPRLEGKHET